MVRSFIAIPCPDELKDKIVEIQSKIPSFCDAKLVERENIHSTLKFLGDVDDNKIEEIKKQLEFAKNLNEFKISLKGLGVFPNENYIRVIWIGVNEPEKIVEIQKQIDENLSSLGFKKEKDFHPHFTIARIKSVTDKFGLKNFIKENSSKEFGSFMTKEVHLMESKLTPNGPVYSRIF